MPGVRVRNNLSEAGVHRARGRSTLYGWEPTGGAIVKAETLMVDRVRADISNIERVAVEIEISRMDM